MDQLTTSDSTHILTELGSHVSRIVDGYIFDAATLPDSLDLEDVLAWLRPRIAHSPVFTSRIQRYPRDVDYPYWVPDPNFDLRDHVTVEPARGPGWPAVRDRIAEICVDRLPLQHRPPWELLVVTGITGVDDVPDGSCVAVLKVHHAVGDGMEAVELARGLFAERPLPQAPHPPAVTSGAAVARAVLRAPVVAFGFARGSLRAQVLTRRAAKAAARGEVTVPTRWRWPSTRFNGRPGPGFAFDRVTFDLGRIDEMRSRLPGITVTDVVTEMIGNAMVSYLRERGEEPAEPLGGKVAFSMRGILDSRSRNNFVVLSVDLHTDLPDRAERLRAVHDSMDAEKRRFRHPAVAELSGALDVAPAPYVTWLARKRLTLPIGQRDTVALGNTMISNVPRQSSADMRFLGGRVVEGFGILGIGDGSCLNHYIVSCGARLTVSFAVDPDQVDTGRYGELLRESFHDLARAHSAPAR